MVGPWCSMQLGALGADVIHIEPPDFAGGRVSRVTGSNYGTFLDSPRNPQMWPVAGVGPTILGTSAGYLTWNFNKRSIVLDLKDETDLGFAYDIIKTSDVF